MKIVILIIIICLIVVTILIIAVLFFMKRPQDPQDPQGPHTIVSLQAYNPDGGFFWHLYNVINLLWMTDRNSKLHPVVVFDSGLYLETRDDKKPFLSGVDPLNWFDHFFYPINETGHTSEEMRKMLKRKQPTPHILQFTRTDLDPMAIPNRVLEYNKLWKKYFRIRPEVREAVEQVKAGCWGADDQFRVACHYRGTDKFPGKSSSEDDPKHMPYKFVLQELNRVFKEFSGNLNRLAFIASDEQPFIEYMKQNAPFEICFTDSIRSKVSTSGMLIDTSNCSTESVSPECTIYQNNIRGSVHRGMQDRSRYQKGLDVLTDVLLMSECHHFLRSRGNVSNWVQYINPEIQIWDLVNLWDARV